MKIQEIFTEYIELKAYLDDSKVVLHNTTLYNKFIKPVYGNKEISTLNLTDYQNFANSLLSGSYKSEQISKETVNQIFKILVDIYRFAIKSNYFNGDNFPAQVKIKLNDFKYQVWKQDLNDIQLAINFGESFISFMKNLSKIQKVYNL